MQVRRNAPIVSKTGSAEDKSSLYVVRACVTSPKEDAFNTVMGQTTRNRITQLANQGVQVCPNHIKPCAIGITSNAQQDQEGKVFCDLNIDRDLPLSHPEAGYPNTEILIRQIAAGRMQDTSIGGTLEQDTTLDCNVCDADMLTDLSCEHWPGITYERDIQDPTNPKKTIKEQVRCVPSWENLGIGEISTCWAGANPDAEIMLNRANLMLENGTLHKSMASRLNLFYGLELDLSRAKPDKTIIDMGKNSNTRRKTMPPEETTETEESTDLSEEEIKALQQKVKDAEAAQKKAEDERDALKGDSEELKTEMETVRKQNIEDYKTMRGANCDSADLKMFEEKQAKLSLAEMKTDAEMLSKALGKEGDEESEESKQRAENKGIFAGRSTTDPNNSQHEDERKERGLPSFMRKKEETN